MRTAIHLTLLLAPAIIFNVMYWDPAPSHFRRSPFRASESPRLRLRRVMKAREPELVILGSSIVQYNIDNAVLSDGLGFPTAKVAQAAIGPAWIFLAFKNVVLRAQKKPRIAVVAFRGDLFMRSTYRTRGRRKKYLDDLAVGRELEVVRRVYESDGDDLSFFLSQNSRLFREREQWRRDLVRRVQSAFTGRSADEILQAGKEVFSDERRSSKVVAQRMGRQEKKGTGEEKRWRANKRLPARERIQRSFIPPMIKLAGKHGIRLIFLRMKEERHTLGDRRGDAFVEELKSYLEERGISLADCSRDPRLQKKHFTVSDHVRRGRSRKIYTMIVVDALKRVL